MAARWSDQDIAASLNRMGIRTGQGMTWTAHRVSAMRRVRDIHAYKSAEKDGEWLTMSEAAKRLGVTSHVIRRLIKDRVLPAEQVMPDAPWQIRASDLQSEAVAAAFAANIARVATMPKDKSLCLSRFRKEVHNERPITTPMMAALRSSHRSTDSPAIGR